MHRDAETQTRRTLSLFRCNLQCLTEKIHWGTLRACGTKSKNCTAAVRLCRSSWLHWWLATRTKSVSCTNIGDGTVGLEKRALTLATWLLDKSPRWLHGERNEQNTSMYDCKQLCVLENAWPVALHFNAQEIRAVSINTQALTKHAVVNLCEHLGISQSDFFARIVGMKTDGASDCTGKLASVAANLKNWIQVFKPPTTTSTGYS